MKKHILHYGLQRSGTNYFETILQSHFHVKMLNSNKNRSHPIQKHFRLYDEKEIIPELKYKNHLLYNDFKECEKSLEISKQIDVIFVISKDPYS